MNQRIKELTGEALDRAMPQTWFGISPDDLDRIAATLAELIVQECLSVVAPDEMDNDTTAAVLNAKVFHLKRHFGVEECF